MAGVRLIFAVSVLAAGAWANDTFALLTDCAASEPGGVVATIHQSDAVRVRYSLGGNSQTCYAVSATVNGKTVEGYLMGDGHPDVAAFEREARARIPSIPPPPKPAPALAVKDKTPEPDGPRSFAGLSGTSPNGQRVSLDRMPDPTVVLYFWSAGSQKSIREADGMEGVFNGYRGKGVSLVGVVSGASAATVRRVLRDEEVIWPQIFDNGEIASRYPWSKESRYYILDRQRNVVAAVASSGEVQRELMKLRRGGGSH